MKRKAYVKMNCQPDKSGTWFDYWIYDGKKLLMKSVDTDMGFIRHLCRTVYSVEAIRLV